MYTRVLVNEKCMNMVIKMPLRYWSIGRSPLIKMPTTTTPCEHARCFEGEGNDMNPKLCHMSCNLLIVVVILLVS